MDSLRELIRCGNADKLFLINHIGSEKVLREHQIKELLESLKSDKGPVVLSAVYKLAKLCRYETPQEVILGFIPLMYDSKWPSVREAVKKELIEFSNEGSVQDLIDSLEKHKPALEDEYYQLAFTALIKICSRRNDSFPTLHENLVKKDGSAYIKNILIRTIYETADPADARASLCFASLYDPNPEVRQAADSYYMKLSI